MAKKTNTVVTVVTVLCLKSIFADNALTGCLHFVLVVPGHAHLGFQPILQRLLGNENLTVAHG